MKFKDSFKFALNNLTTRGLRSWLTIIGIIIGVAAIVAIVSVGQGLQGTIQNQLSSLGSDIIYVLPGSSLEYSFMQSLAPEPGNLTEKDLKLIKIVEGVLYVAPEIVGMVDMEYSGNTKNLYLLGTDENWKKVRESSAGLESGRFLMKGDKNVVVLGNKIATDAFDKPIYIGSQIKIEGDSFRVIGILEEFGGMAGMGEDSYIFVSLEDAKEYSSFGSNEEEYYAMEVRVESERTEEIAEKIKQQLMISRHVNEENINFGIMTPKMISSIVSNILNAINLFLYGIAAISLLVGAVGIANTMFTSVTERTRQIGILKALGMTNKGVMNLFLVESALIGFVGGILGLFIGFVISGIIGQAATFMLATTMIGGGSLVSIGPGLVIFALSFSVIVGVISGIFPARRASRLQPVEALRYE